MKLGRALLAILLLLGSATSARAAEVVADPLIIADVMSGAGYAAQLDTSGSGDPIIRSNVSGYNFIVYFYDCTNNAACKTIQFSAAFDPGERAPSFEKINNWNKSRRFGRAFVDSQGDPTVQMDIDLEDGGMSSALFVDNLEYWQLTVSEYARFIFTD